MGKCQSVDVAIHAVAGYSVLLRSHLCWTNFSGSKWILERYCEWGASLSLSAVNTTTDVGSLFQSSSVSEPFRFSTKVILDDILPQLTWNRSEVAQPDCLLQ
ncbi:hypothetical protein ONZ45_g12423 [Pleurotus djamor]|nr:hypothetical protein ONZ45_g12423 [Pleurotus djamor]